MKQLILILFLFLFITSYSQSVVLPVWFKTTTKSKGLDKKYLVNSYLNSGTIEADFNGDDINDLAVLIVEKATKKKGVLLIHGKTNQHFLLGAGNKFGNGSDNFEWADKWELYDKKSAVEPVFNKENGDLVAERQVKLIRPAILIEDLKDGEALSGGLIYWDGSKYVWIHQGE